MIEMTPEARVKLEEYLNRMRSALRGSRSVKASEVEQDVQQHVELALAGTAAPVGSQQLAAVLEQLGPPERWLTDDDRPAWRRVLQHISSGPEDWRLAYLTFGVFAFGLISFPIGIGIVFLVLAYFLARADTELVTSRGEALGARRWLVLPPIWIAMLAFAALVLIVPVIALGALGLSDGAIHLAGGIPHTRPETAERVRIEVGYIATVAGAWWLFISPMLAMAIRAIRALFFPLTARLARRHAGVLALIGAIVAGIGSLLLFVIR